MSIDSAEAIARKVVVCMRVYRQWCLPPHCMRNARSLQGPKKRTRCRQKRIITIRPR